MVHKSPRFNRRKWLQWNALLPGSLLFSSCGYNKYSSKRVGKSAPDKMVNKESLWARRKVWSGEEWIKCVVQIGDRTLMVAHQGDAGWDFPGGKIKPGLYGERNESHSDLVRAATVMVHDQALIPILAGEAIVLAYGYVIDPRTNINKMMYWINVFSLSDYLPTPQPNLRDTRDARWVAIDDPELGQCLKMRLNEIKRAGEGKTLMIEPCR